MSDAKPTVFFDGSCPICRREIDFYRKRRGAEDVEWCDLSTMDDKSEVAPGLSHADALRRFHVRRSDGSLVSGSQAFGVMWARIAGFRSIGRIAQWPGVRHVLDLGYAGLLKVRPRLQTLFR